MMAALSFFSCDDAFLDLTSGEMTIKEINGRDSKGPCIVITHESKVYYAGENIYDKEPSYGTGDTSGNGNNCLDPGEKISYGVKCANVGRNYAVSVQARVSTSSPYADIPAEPYSLGFVEGGNTYGQSVAIFISLDANTPHGHKLRLDFQFSDSSGNVWNDYCIIVVQ
jgi:hypothetical protein